jgi:hypothetical protein
MSSVRLSSYEKLEVIYFGIQFLIVEHFFQQVRLDVGAEVVALNVHQFMKDSGFLHFPGTMGVDDDGIAAVIVHMREGSHMIGHILID